MPEDHNERTTPLISIPQNAKTKRQFWQEEVKRWQRSGQSQRFYSRERGLVESQLSYWVNQFKPTLSSPSQASGFRPIRIKDTTPPYIRIKRPDGLCIELPSLPDKDQLKMLLAILLC